MNDVVKFCDLPGNHSTCCTATLLILRLFIEHQCVEACSSKSGSYAPPFLLFPTEDCCLCLAGTVELTLTMHFVKVTCAAERASSEEPRLKSPAGSCPIKWPGWGESARHIRRGRSLLAGALRHGATPACSGEVLRKGAQLWAAAARSPGSRGGSWTGALQPAPQRPNDRARCRSRREVSKLFPNKGGQRQNVAEHLSCLFSVRERHTVTKCKTEDLIFN